MSILSKIVKNKKKEVELAKKKTPVEALLKEIMKSPANRNFRDAFEYNDFVIIGELKKKSPSKGTLKGTIDVKKISGIYERAGIKAMSVVTDKKFFDGNPMWIQDIKKNASVPVLRKDFVIDEYQIYESRFYRADALLLIASVLEKRVLAQFIKKTHFLNMTPVVEASTPDEVKKALSAGAEIIGINARDLKTFKINLGKIKSLIKYIPRDKIVICESGITAPDDIDEILVDEKIKGVLVGTAFMKAKGEREIKELAQGIINRAKRRF